jgi:hypothetical protein
MSASGISSRSDRSTTTGRWLFAAVAIAAALFACLLAGWAPLGFSIVTVFLFAGPHNWMEGRYFLSQMPARWGPLRLYFLTGIGGVLLLAAAFAALPSIDRWLGLDSEHWLALLATWNSALVLWVAALATLRARFNPKRAWPWIWPAAGVLVALAWLWPRDWSLALVYLHPLVAIWFLDLELKRRRPAWRSGYHVALAFAALFFVSLFWRLGDAPNLPGDDALSWRIARHAGADLVGGVSSHFLVAAHTYLEMLHYDVWCIALPLVAFREAPWKLANLPLGRRSHAWRLALGAVLLTGLFVAIALWAGFLADYPLTRDIYFTVAILHVLAEAPFLLRLL